MKTTKSVSKSVKSVEKTTKDLLELISEYREIAGEALYLADEYAGGESETANELSKQFDKVEDLWWKVIGKDLLNN